MKGYDVSAARLNRFYISNEFCCRVMNCCINSVGFTDHHFHFSISLSPKTMNLVENSIAAICNTFNY